MSEDKREDESIQSTGSAAAEKPGRRISKKILAVFIVVILVSLSVFTVWYFYYRHWSAHELSSKIVKDEFGVRMGFESSLAGKSVVVEGKVTDIEFYDSTIGSLSVVTLDHEDWSSLVYWDTVSFDIGDRIERRISFEWAYWNDERHVVSPQVWIPFAYAFSFAVTMNAVSYVNSDGSEIGLHNDGDDTVIEIRWMKEPVRLAEANCTLTAGNRSGHMDYYFYSENKVTDSIQNLSLGISPNHMIEFSDENDDGYLDNGDLFTLKDLESPDTDCGIKTYILNIDWPRDSDERHDDSVHGVWCYVPFLKDGAFWPASWEFPVLRGFMERADGVRTLRIDHVDRQVLWQNMSIILTDGDNYAQWEPNTLDQSWEYLGVKELGLLEVEAGIEHSAGNGIVTAGDCVNVGVDDFGSFPSDRNYTLSILCDGNQILSKTFGVNDSPIARLEPYAPAAGGTTDGVGFTFTRVHVGVNSTFRSMDLPWDYVFVNLTDGTNSLIWTASSSSLHLGVGAGACFANMTLGSVAVQLCIYDLNGDGQVNRGDRLELRTPDVSGFSSSTTYTVTAAYVYGGAEICSAEFTG